MNGSEFVPLSLVPMLTGIFVAVACALPGNFLVLRRQALIGDAISHVVLPGIVVAFLLTGVVSTWPMLLGAAGAALVAVLAVFFHYTRIGMALRAVADDHQAALSVGIPLKTIWIIVWSVAGFVGLVAGIMWGSKSGVQFSLSLIALKALPVLMLGGFTSIPGAIVGGLIIGVGEKLFEFFIGPMVGGPIGALAYEMMLSPAVPKNGISE